LTKRRKSSISPSLIASAARPAPPMAASLPVCSCSSATSSAIPARASRVLPTTLSSVFENTTWQRLTTYPTQTGGQDQGYVCDWMSTARQMWLWPVAILVSFPIKGYRHHVEQADQHPRARATKTNGSRRSSVLLSFSPLPCVQRPLATRDRPASPPGTGQGHAARRRKAPRSLPPSRRGAPTDLTRSLRYGTRGCPCRAGACTAGPTTGWPPMRARQAVLTPTATEPALVTGFR